MKIFAGGLAFFLILSASGSQGHAGSVEYVKVTDVSGKAEFLGPSSGRWKSLGKQAFLKKNTKARTGPKSAADLSFDWKLDNVAKLGESSNVDFLTISPLKVFLEKGSLYVFREGVSSGPSRGAIKIVTKDLTIQVEAGGCIVTVSAKGTIVRIFSDSVLITDPANPSKKISAGEGFAYDRFLKRMRYADYADWQTWIKKVFERKDRLSEVMIDKIVEQND